MNWPWAFVIVFTTPVIFIGVGVLSVIVKDWREGKRGR